MVKRTRSKNVPRHRAPQYRKVAESLWATARDLVDLTREESGYGNAIGVLVVHSAIAWTDALTIAYDGRKHTGSKHVRAADLLLEAVGDAHVDVDKRKKLETILQAKDEVSYMGEYYTEERAHTLFTEMRAYRRWARGAWDKRPPAGRR